MFDNNEGSSLNREEKFPTINREIDLYNPYILHIYTYNNELQRDVFFEVFYYPKVTVIPYQNKGFLGRVTDEGIVLNSQNSSRFTLLLTSDTDSTYAARLQTIDYLKYTLTKTQLVDSKNPDIDQQLAKISRYHKSILDRKILKFDYKYGENIKQLAFFPEFTLHTARQQTFQKGSYLAIENDFTNLCFLLDKKLGEFQVNSEIRKTTLDALHSANEIQNSPQ